MSDKLRVLAILMASEAAHVAMSLVLAVLLIIYIVTFFIAKRMHEGMTLCLNAREWINKEVSRHV